jgi:isoleucyl-tRNA synthetase
MAPILTFTAEEIWGYVPGQKPRAESVLLAEFPPAERVEGDEALLATWQLLLDVREAVTKSLEQARQEGRIGHSLDARVQLGFETDGALGELLGSRLAGLPTLFIVSQVERSELTASEESPLVAGLRVAVERAAGEKCARCWNYRTSVGADANHETLCAPCIAALAHAP